MASSSSAPRKRKREHCKHDVFLSFRGEDTRYGFTGNLYDELIRKGFNAYRDDENLGIGKSIRPELLQAIEESKAAIVILSKNYADSTWCLDELVKIVECVETTDLILCPVFYKVDPSDVGGQQKEFDLTKLYEKNSGIAEDRLNSWRNALQKVGNLAGIHVKDKGDRYETNVRDEIVRKISEELKRTSGIGLDEKMRNMEIPTADIVPGKTFRMNCKTVLEYLKNDQVLSIGIYRMGGVGKTTLMRHVHNLILADQDTFGDVCWVTVSQDFSIQRLQDKIFKKLKQDLPSEDDEMSRAASLCYILKKKGKYILILDDVWDNIPLVKVGIPVSVNSCRLIITTRSLDVCNKMACQQTINISHLSRDEAWELFKGTLGSQEKLAPEVIKTAEDVARRCGGLPLAIIAMAGSMRGISDIHEWRDAVEDLKKPETSTISGMGSEVIKVLKHSYNRLNNEELQQCFLSCALYPEDYEIPRDELIDYCIVKGLIKKKDSRRAEIDKGHTTLNKLIRCCLLEDCYDDEHVKMHDLVREMALHIMKSEKHQQVMVIDGLKLADIPKDEEWTEGGLKLADIPKDEEWMEDLEVVSLIKSGIKEILDGRSPRCPKLSTLLLRSNYRLTQISDSFFVCMRNLQVLNLRSCYQLRMLPDSIGDLINLKALWLGGCHELHYIPSLRKLKKLEYLDLRNTEIVPDGVGGLISLRCLYMDCGVTMEELMELQQLEVFHGQVLNVSDYNVLVRLKWFQRLWNDYSLYVTSFHESYFASDDFLDDGRGENALVLEGLSLGGRGVVDVPCDIKKLMINKCDDTGKCLLEFGEDTRVREWKRIEIFGCREVEWVAAMPSVQLPGIEELYVQNMENMKGIFKWGEYYRDSTPSTTIPTPSGGGVGSFSRLKVLNIECGKQLKVGLTVNCIAHLPVLEELYISDCSGLEEIIGGGGGRGGEDFHHGHHNNNITLPNLKLLYLYDLPSLRSIYDKGNIICDSIRWINLQGCTGLKRLPITSSTTITSSLCSGESSRPNPFPCLKEIYINKSEKEWWESLELVHPTYHPLLRPFLHIDSFRVGSLIRIIRWM